MKSRNKQGCNGHDKGMWVKAKEKEKNKEKHINGAMFLTPLVTCDETWSVPSIYRQSP
jgi:hypothetical protein